MKKPQHSIKVMVPIAHRMGNICNGKNGVINKYKLACVIANDIHRNSVSGGGYGFGRDYDIWVYMPQHKVADFKVILRANGIRYKDYGVQDYE